ncbi:hypothetical protein ACFQV2_25220 [Actinokineospora soli]|uniref:Peptide/nickel transport system permease protein n=1 Tax=Actinokineospora soli TaxID=1048753 RepID=A0ABW2TR65_9PSEU
MRRPVAVLLVAVPLLLSLVGPWFVPEAPTRSGPFLPEGFLGTDFVGRDAWHQVLDGGRTVVLVALAATALAYAVGVPWGWWRRPRGCGSSTRPSCGPSTCSSRSRRCCC